MMRRGRPRLPDNLRKIEQVRVVLTVDERNELIALSESLNMSMSALARSFVVKGLERTAQEAQ
jgi:hypothetical protein